jgi:hypothetical protein
MIGVGGQSALEGRPTIANESPESMKRNRQMALRLGAMVRPANPADRFPQLLTSYQQKLWKSLWKTVP